VVGSSSPQWEKKRKAWMLGKKLERMESHINSEDREVGDGCSFLLFERIRIYNIPIF